MSSLDWRLPVQDEPDLTWSFLVFEAARGGVRVPRWLLMAVPAVAAERMRKRPHEVEGEDVDTLLARLPANPVPWLQQALVPLDVAVPGPDATLLLSDDQASGTFRAAVPIPALVHDAAVVLRNSYGRGGFFACMEVLDQPRWDARAAVAAGLYLVMLRYG